MGLFMKAVLRMDMLNVYKQFMCTVTVHFTEAKSSLTKLTDQVNFLPRNSITRENGSMTCLMGMDAKYMVKILTMKVNLFRAGNKDLEYTIGIRNNFTQECFLIITWREKVNLS